jgi:hypothetical protein
MCGAALCTTSADFSGHQTNSENLGSGVHGEGRFVVLPAAVSFSQAEAACAKPGYLGLASVHNGAEMQTLERLCGKVAGGGNGQAIAGVANGCWIGLRANAQRTGFSWGDNTDIDFTFWSNGEPNNWGQNSGPIGNGASAEGESAVEVNMGRKGFLTCGGGATHAACAAGALSGDVQIKGLWNDAHVNGIAAHGYDSYTGATHASAFEQGGATGGAVQSGFGLSGAFGMFPVCQTQAAPAGQFGVERQGADSTGKVWQWKITTGQYVAVHTHTTWNGAKAYCDQNYGAAATPPGTGGMASIHTQQANVQTWTACNQLLGNVWDSDVAARRNAAVAKGTSATNGKAGIRACGCWIGLNDKNDAEHKEFADGTTTTDIEGQSMERQDMYSQGQDAYKQCHGYEKPKGFWYTAEPNGLGSGTSAENSVEIRMCFDPTGPYKPKPPSQYAGATPIPYNQRVPETEHWLTNCPHMALQPTGQAVFGQEANTQCHEGVNFGPRGGPPISRANPHVWNDANEAKPQPFICEMSKPMGSQVVSSEYSPPPAPPPCPTPATAGQTYPPVGGR